MHILKKWKKRTDTDGLFKKVSKIDSAMGRPKKNGVCHVLHFWKLQGTIGCTPNGVPMVFIVFSRDSWGF